MHCWRLTRVLWAAAILLSFDLPVGARDGFGDEPPEFVELLPAIDAEPNFALDDPPLLRDSQEPMALPASRRRATDSMRSPDGERSPFKTRLYWIPSQNVSSQPGDWSQSGEQINLAAPLYIAPEGGNIWLATGGVERMSISTSTVLPDSQLPVPDELWKIAAGAMNFRDLDNGWKTAAILTVGSASDQPFAGVRDMTVTAIGGLEVPFRDRDAWSFSLFYSPTSQLPFPLPGVAYIWRPSDTLNANIGIPFSLRYQPTESFSFVASYFPLTNVNILAKRQLSEFWSFYGGYQVVNETYWLADRVDEHELFYLFDQRLTLGLQRKIIWGLSVDFSAGYVFDRQVFQADGFSDTRQDEITIDPGAVGAIQLIWSL